MWTTRLDWNGTHWLVYLSRGDQLVATMTLDEWAKLSATEFLTKDQVSQAVHEQRLVAAGIPE
jgi:hypothetical protein